MRELRIQAVGSELAPATQAHHRSRIGEPVSELHGKYRTLTYKKALLVQKNLSYEQNSLSQTAYLLSFRNRKRGAI